MFLLFISMAFATTLNYQNTNLTPGVRDTSITQKNISETICKRHYTRDVRSVTRSTKKKVFKAYGLDYKTQSSKYEVDHVVSLELGGGNDSNNLWPQKYCPVGNDPLKTDCWGAREKDRVETTLHRWICSGEVTLDEAVNIILTDWINCYKKIRLKKVCNKN